MEITAAVLLAVASLVLGVGLMVYSVRRKDRQARARIRNTYLKGQREWFSQFQKVYTQITIHLRG